MTWEYQKRKHGHCATTTFLVWWTLLTAASLGLLICLMLAGVL